MKIQLSTENKQRPPEDQLEFGKYFTPHMFVAEYDATTGWDEGKITPYAPLQLDPAASVLHYGQALFEGVKAFHQVNGDVAIFRPMFNAQRLRRGAERLCLPLPPEQLFLSGLNELLKVDRNWMPQSKGTSMYIRPTLIGTEGFLGVRPSKKALFFIILSPVGRYYKQNEESVRIWVEKTDLRAAPGGLGDTKAGANYAASLRAALQAKSKGYAQVLWTDVTHKNIEEVGTMNVFFKIKDKTLTPALNGSILEGGTRSCCIELLKENGFTVEERAISLEEVREAWQKGELQEVFGTGTAAVITPVESLATDIEVWTMPKGFGPTAKWLFDQITAIQYGEVPDRHQWLIKVK